ncbi:hypothetical protein [Rothia dentocariosa]|uniref:hypothetical protein n=1 Tax=Rothia dentocariosa TaxID=2047 RepID=UPI0028E51B79|nr:hypothetical protein [Rothia dentocariosa]
MVESKYYPSYRTIMGWYGWLMQNNPDIFSAQTIPILVAAIHAHNTYGADVIMRILGDMHRVLGAASYSALGLGASAKTTEVRANAAEALASLADRGHGRYRFIRRRTVLVVGSAPCDGSTN